ncbi:MAG: AmmeMemoRadiSam system radical SAM enzyme, partial [Elusimicrobia bacterium]|nr:AmmeMemoRadiSam system radical SAM enzyme [Elusimicrobiota bacterium]
MERPPATATHPALGDRLGQHTREGTLYEILPAGKVRCYACGHRCVIRDGLDGICRVRFNRGGTLYVPWGYMGAIQCDPIEKKPFFHALPGSLAMSFGMLGCDFRCAYCQNYITSQALRDPTAGVPPIEVTPKEYLEMAERYGAKVVASTYNEPLITSEWAVAIFQEARQRGLQTAYISNGNGTPEVLDYLHPWVDLYKVDLKGFNDKYYRQFLGGVLQNVLDTIRWLYERKFWLEIVTLTIQGFNDSDDELTKIARFIASISPDIPWHVTAFHKDYKMQDPDNTSPATLIRAAQIGEAEGLRYVYAGNLPGQVGKYENTYCPSCRTLLIERCGFEVMQFRLNEGTCPQCHISIPGVWGEPRPR